ncbi:MAG: AI-2E family transporter [Thermoanaerobaculia bacterium]
MPLGELERRGFSGQRALVGSAAAVLVVAGLKLAAPLFVPIAFALFLGVLSQPLLQALLRRRVPVTLAVMLIMLALAAVATAFVLLLLGSLGEFREVGPGYYAEFQDRLSYTVEWWGGKGIAILDWIPAKYQRPEAIVELAGGPIKGILSLASQVTIILLTLVFMLVEAAALPGKLERLPARHRAALERVSPVSRELQRYLLIKTAMSLAIGITTGLWVAILGVDFPVLCGMVAFACHFIPNVGALLAAAPPMLLAFVQYDLTKSFAVLAGYLVIGTLLGNLLEPTLLGRRLGLSTLAVFVSLLFWGWLWGPIGMLLSVPLTGTIKILLENSGSYAWIATLLDSSNRRLAAASAAEPAVSDEA